MISAHVSAPPYLTPHVYTGFQHMPVGPLTPQLEQMAFLASTQDSKTQGNRQGSVEASGTSAGAVKAGHVKAFSGRGHTLSSGSSGQTAPSDVTVEEDPILHTARLVAEKRLTDLRQQESALQQQVCLEVSDVAP